MLSECSDFCSGCYLHFVGCCLAGHGDNDFVKMTKEKAKEALEKGYIKEIWLDELKTLYPSLFPKKEKMVFKLDDVEIKRFKEFQELVRLKHGEYGQLTISFTPTGIANNITVYSNLEKETKDITNYDNW